MMDARYADIDFKSAAAIILCAGFSTRMGTDKTTLDIAGKTPVELCLAEFSRFNFGRIIICHSNNNRDYIMSLATRFNFVAVPGGNTRQESVYNALCALTAAPPEVVLIHDAARCLVPGWLIASTTQGALINASAIAALSCRDTARVNGKLIDRAELALAQTPQAFNFVKIFEAYKKAIHASITYTDDCAIFEDAGHTPHFVEGSIMNQKLTYKEDMPLFNAFAQKNAAPQMRIGYGEDTHRLIPGEALVLGGVHIPFRLMLEGHSDADVLVHAVIDALLGAACLGDIGQHFPDTDKRYKGISSLKLLGHVAALLKQDGYSPVNIDATIIAQEPKLLPHIQSMRENIARTLGADLSLISVKATTPERLGPEGELKGITVRCVALLAF